MGKQAGGGRNRARAGRAGRAGQGVRTSWKEGVVGGERTLRAKGSGALRPDASCLMGLRRTKT